MKKLSTERANELKSQGITHIASVVKSLYNTEYYNINPIDAILRNNGRWIAAVRGQYNNGGRGPVGTIASQVDWTHTIRAHAI